MLQRIARAGLVKSFRGPRGGFKLADKDGDTTLLEVYEAVEGPLEEGRCLMGTSVCSGERCILGGLLETTNREIREYLAGTKLSELAQVYGREGE